MDTNPVIQIFVSVSNRYHSLDWDFMKSYRRKRTLASKVKMLLSKEEINVINKFRGSLSESDRESFDKEYSLFFEIIKHVLTEKDTNNFKAYRLDAIESLILSF